VTDKYAPAAEGWTETEYADSQRYLQRRAELIVDLGPRLEPGDVVCDLACGDGGLAEFLLPRGLGYLGVDASPEMAAAAQRRLNGRARVELADLNDFAPGEAVAATTVFRAVYYAHDQDQFFRRVASYTQKKLVFDLNPRQYDLGGTIARLRAAGFADVAARPFFVPQRVQLPGPVAAVARAAERSGPLARLALRFRFTYVVVASRG
jgi:SAM-dependent methyltransferase